MVRDVHKVSVADRGLRCNFYAVPGTTNAPAVILIDGAGGGFPADERIATELAASGYPTLAVAYFSNRLGEPSGLPSSLCEIPLEYFFSAIDWMKERPEVCRDKIVAMGQSRGSEAALLVASHRADIAGVLAFSPSNMVWQSQSYGTEIKSAWTLRGIPVDYVSYGYVPGGNMVSSTTIVLDNPNSAIEAAQIAVEKINGPILFASSTDDQVWAAARMANLAVARLRSASFKYSVTNLQFDNASHLLMGFGPGMVRAVAGDFTLELGGTEQGTTIARDAGWNATINFLQQFV